MLKDVLLAVGLAMCLSVRHDVNADQAATGKATISGRVLSDSGVVLVGATVKLRNISGVEVEQGTDKQGQFAFTELPPGWYELNAWQPGYSLMSYGATRVRGAGTPLVLAAETVLSDLAIRLPFGAVVSGVVRRPDGQPLGGINVSVFETTITAGGVRVAYLGGSGRTSPTGEFRIFNIAPGQYVLKATPIRAVISAASGAPTSYAVTYHPSALSAQAAAPIVVGSGEQTAGADILVKVVPLARLEGQLIDVAGSPSPGGTVSLNQLEPSGATAHVATAPVNAGAFMLPNVPPGMYLLRAAGPSSGANAGLQASSVITVAAGADIAGIRLFLRPSATVSGQVTYVGDGPAPRTMPFRLIAYNADDLPMRLSSVVVATLRLDGSFVFSGVEAGKYRLRIQAATPTATAARIGWALSSVRVDEKEVVGSSFDVGVGQSVENVKVTVTNRLGQLSGTVLDRDRRPATAFTVIVFPADKTHWSPELGRVVASRPANTGEFRVEPLVPGTYRVATVRDPEPNEWLLPEFLEKLVAGSVVVSVTDQAPATLHLVVGGPG